MVGGTSMECPCAAPSNPVRSSQHIWLSSRPQGLGQLEIGAELLHTSVGEPGKMSRRCAPAGPIARRGYCSATSMETFSLG